MDLGFQIQLLRAVNVTILKKNVSWSSTVIRMRYFWRSCIATFKWKRQEQTQAANLHPPQLHLHHRSSSNKIILPLPLPLVLLVLQARLRTKQHVTAQRHASRPAWEKTTFWILCQNIRLCKVLLPILTGVPNKRHCKLSHHIMWQSTCYWVFFFHFFQSKQ